MDESAAVSGDVLSISPVLLDKPPTDQPSGTSLTGQDKSAEICQPASFKFLNEYETAMTVQGESVKNKQQTGNTDDFLLRSIDSAHLETSVRLLTSNNSFTQNGLNQALISACRRGYKLLVQMIVLAGANIEHRDENGNTPLLICVENGFTDIVRFLVSRHANVNAINSTGNTALILSVRPEGSTDLIMYLLQQRDVDVNHKNHRGCTALMGALEVMDVESIYMLEKASLRPAIFRRRQYTQDICVTDRCSRELHNVYILLESFLDTGKSALELAIQKRDVTSLEILLNCQFSSSWQKRRYINSAFMYIFRHFQVSKTKTVCPEEITMIQRLLEYGAETDQEFDMRPLCVAVEVGDLHLVELLCRYGALAHENASTGRQDVLFIAARDDRQDLIELLLDCGYQVDTNCYSFSDSPLACALNHDHTSCAKYLIQRGAKIDLITALLTAVGHPTSKYIDFLLENYTLEVMDYFSDTSDKASHLLISVLQKGSSEVVSRFLDNTVGANQWNPCQGSQIMASTSGGIAKCATQEDSGLIQALRRC